ncbi:hypothetical protein L3Q82_018225, partial [Scortum barcoo]
MKAHSGEVGVFVRFRPTANFAQHLIECLPDGQTVNICHKKDSRKPLDSRKSQLKSWSFQVEGVLRDVSQEEFYARVCRRVVLGALEGYNGTVMCFGQTGAGKTYTMTGSTESYKQRGLIPRALQEVFQEVEKRTEHAFSVHLSYLEIYNETLVDLLSSLQGLPPSPRGMVVMEEPGRGVFIRGLSLHPVHSEEEALNLLFEGEMNRIIGSHALNRNSSRSHCIFTVHIESHSRTLSDAKYITSKLNLVDLAGSERLGKTGTRRRDHIPFRQSKLTHALKDSLGGNCNTVLVANIYGEAAQIEETLSTLRFAGRMKCVRTDPAVNEHMDPAAQIKKLQRDIQMLKEELSLCNTLASRSERKMKRWHIFHHNVNRPSSSLGPLTEAQQAEIRSQVQRYLEGSLEEISITSIRQVQAAFAQFKLAVKEQGQKVKAQLSQKYSLVEKESANTAAIKVALVGGCFVNCFRSWTPEAALRRWRPAALGNLLRPQKTPIAQVPPKPNLKRLGKNTGNQSKRQGDGSPVPRKSLESASKLKLNSEKDQDSQEPDTESQDTQESQPPVNEPPNPDSPPPKAEAFEDFKVGQGSEINHILKENKAVLLERHSLLRQLTEEVNSVKKEIDCTAANIQRHKELRENQGQLLFLDGEPLLQEPDATLLTQLRELKALYRQRYEVLRDIKAEVNYCQHLVDQCRVRLLSEFESWYKKSFLVPEEELDLTMEKTLTQEDAEEQLLPDSPSSESFHNARYRMLKR